MGGDCVEWVGFIDMGEVEFICWFWGVIWVLSEGEVRFIDDVMVVL